MNEIPKIAIDFASLNFSTIIPMLCVIIFALIIICLDLINKNIKKEFYISLSVFALLLDLAFLLTSNLDNRGFFDLVLIDGLSILSQVTILIVSIFFIFVFTSKLDFHEHSYPEYFALYLFVVGSFQFMVSSDNLILILLSLETASLALYTMIAMHNKLSAIEASIKYFTLGAIAASFFAFGAMLLYAQTSSIELFTISENLNLTNYNNHLITLLGAIFILLAIGFKLSLFPFHIWVADVYEGSNASFAGFLSIVPKIAAFVVAIRFFEIFIVIDDKFIEYLLYTIVILSMTIPNIIALLQKDLKRMLAYSSISNAGFAFVGVLLGTTQATQALFFYWIMFLIANIGLFTMLWLNTSKDNDSFSSEHDLLRYSGLMKEKPFMAIVMSIFLFTLAGVPPFSLFWGKMYIISSAINSGFLILALIMAINSVIAAYYYLKPLVYILFEQKNENENLFENVTVFHKIVVSVCAFIAITSLFYMEDLLSLISYYVQTSGF